MNKLRLRSKEKGAGQSPLVSMTIHPDSPAWPSALTPTCNPWDADLGDLCLLGLWPRVRAAIWAV
jgi:hypothetical protein